MKSTFVYTIGAIAITAISLALPTAVAAAGYKNADKTGESIAEFRDEIVNVKKAVDATLASLDKIVMEATVDPRGAFKQFDKNVPKVESAGKKAKKRAEDMKALGEGYFKQWEKELASVNNPEIRKLAEERKAEVTRDFRQDQNRHRSGA